MPRNSNKPRLAPLQYGAPFCELCRETIRVGQAVAWWRVPGTGRTEALDGLLRDVPLSERACREAALVRATNRSRPTRTRSRRRTRLEVQALRDAMYEGSQS